MSLKAALELRSEVSLGQRDFCFGHSHGISLSHVGYMWKREDCHNCPPRGTRLLQMEKTAKVGAKGALLKAEVRISEKNL